MKITLQYGVVIEGEPEELARTIAEAFRLAAGWPPILKLDNVAGNGLMAPPPGAMPSGVTVRWPAPVCTCPQPDAMGNYPSRMVVNCPLHSTRYVAAAVDRSFSGGAGG